MMRADCATVQPLLLGTRVAVRNAPHRSDYFEGYVGPGTTLQLVHVLDERDGTSIATFPIQLVSVINLAGRQ